MATKKEVTVKEMGKGGVSVVVPFYNEEGNAALLVRKVADVMRKGKRPWELLAVDDGSRDRTPAILKELEKDFSELKVILLRRNYGQTAAMQAGFDAARGDVVVTMDGDLQNDPKDIPNLLRVMDEEGADVVSGWRKNRKDNELTSNLPSRIANRMLPWVTGVKLHDSGCSLKAYRREVLDEVRIYGEMHRFIPAVALQFGGKVAEVEVTHHPRHSGTSNYGLDKSVRVVLDMLQLYFFRKFLHRPMHFFGYVGLVCMGSGGLMGVYLTLLKMSGDKIGGRPLLLLSVMLILVGVQMLATGILAELLVRIYHEPRGRKQYAVK